MQLVLAARREVLVNSLDHKKPPPKESPRESQKLLRSRGQKQRAARRPRPDRLLDQVNVLLSGTEEQMAQTAAG